MHQHRIRLVFLAGRAEHHVHEVGRVVEVVARIHEGLAGVVLVGHRNDGRQLGDQPIERDSAMLGIGEVGDVVVEGRQRADHADHDRHRVRVAAEALVELHQLLMHHGVVLDRAFEFGLLRGARQFAVLQQPGDFKEVALFRQLLDRIAAIQQFALVAVDESDLRLAAGGRQEAGVVGEQPVLAPRVRMSITSWPWVPTITGIQRSCRLWSGLRCDSCS
jgi:hypothetical protein